jgi:hypothetical protein
MHEQTNRDNDNNTNNNRSLRVVSLLEITMPQTHKLNHTAFIAFLCSDQLGFSLLDYCLPYISLTATLPSSLSH